MPFQRFASWKIVGGEKDSIGGRNIIRVKDHACGKVCRGGIVFGPAFDGYGLQE